MSRISPSMVRLSSSVVVSMSKTSIEMSFQLIQLIWKSSFFDYNLKATGSKIHQNENGFSLWFMMNRSSIIIFGRWFRFILHMKEHQKLTEMCVFYIKVKNGPNLTGSNNSPSLTSSILKCFILSTKQNVDWHFPELKMISDCKP